MKKRMLALSVLIIASLACSMFSGGSSTQLQNPSTQQANALKGISTPTPENPDVEQPCQANKWEVVPINFVSIPGHDQPSWVGTVTPPNGWNIVVVNYAVLNGSDLWGMVSFNNSPTITTEGGFSYNSTGMQGVWLQSDQEIPVPATEIIQQTSPFGNGDLGKTVNQPIMYSTDYIPPKFVMAGYVEGYTTQWFGPAEAWDYFPFYTIFKVAATQKQLTLTMPGIKIDCIQHGVSQTGTIPSRTFDLGSYKSSWTQYPTTTSLPNLGTTINYPDFGTITIKGVQSASGSVTIQFQFTNDNQGAETSGTLKAYIIDGLGYVHTFQGGQFDAGPAATVDGQDLTVLGGVSDTDKDQKIVFWIETRQGSTTFDSYAVFSFNR